MLHMRYLVLAAAIIGPGVTVAQAPATTQDGHGFAEPSTSPHTMPPKPKSMPIPKWDPATVATISGKVVGVWRDKHYGVVVGVDTEKDDVVLCSVGPAYFIDPRMTFAAGNDIEVTGSRVHYQGRWEMLASVLKHGETTVNVRSDKGKKLW